jgi:hypothetical protein
MKNIWVSCEKHRKTDEILSAVHRRKAASRCHNDPALRTPVLPPVGGSRNVQPIASYNAIIGYQLYCSECVEEKTQVFLVLFCYLYTDADQMRVESNIVHF